MFFFLKKRTFTPNHVLFSCRKRTYPFEDGCYVHIAMCSHVGGHISSIFSSNSEANASELLENLEEMFPRH